MQTSFVIYKAEETESHFGIYRESSTQRSREACVTCLADLTGGAPDPPAGVCGHDAAHRVLLFHWNSR